MSTLVLTERRAQEYKEYMEGFANTVSRVLQDLRSCADDKNAGLARVRGQKDDVTGLMLLRRSMKNEQAIFRIIARNIDHAEQMFGEIYVWLTQQARTNEEKVFVRNVKRLHEIMGAYADVLYEIEEVHSYQKMYLDHPDAQTLMLFQKRWDAYCDKFAEVERKNSDIVDIEKYVEQIEAIDWGRRNMHLHPDMLLPSVKLSGLALFSSWHAAKGSTGALVFAGLFAALLVYRYISISARMHLQKLELLK